MTNVVKLRKGLNLKLSGTALRSTRAVAPSHEYALLPSAFEGVAPKVVVKEGETVKAGDALFVSKQCVDLRFASPVSGKVTGVVRGERRKLLAVKVEADKDQVYADYGKHDPAAMSGDQVKELLLRAGLFGYINQMPYAVVASPADQPKAIFVSALRDMPLAADFEYQLKGEEAAFAAGLKALGRMAKVCLGVGPAQEQVMKAAEGAAEVTVFDGPCPAGNVTVHINHLDPINKGEVVWTVEPTAVIFIGRLMLTGRVDLHRVVAVAGSEVKEPCYVNVLVGTPVADILGQGLKKVEGTRLIDGDPLTGKRTSMDSYVSGHTSELTAIPEGDDAAEMLGWILPRPNQFSANRSYLSWLMGNKEYTLDARVKGSERHMIMSGEYDKVLPMDIFGEYLIKAIIAGDIDKMEQLGIYEVAPEDFAVAEFVCSSKMELQKIVREGLNMLRKENA